MEALPVKLTDDARNSPTPIIKPVLSLIFTGPEWITSPAALNIARFFSAGVCPVARLKLPLPAAPAGPCGPCGPAGPCGPCGPAAPSVPFVPFVPAGPGTP